jgi:hypothetical protein
MSNPNSSFYKLFGHQSGINKLSPSQLNKTTYLEIFNSRKNSLKKPLNYINYTKHDHDVITNQRYSSAYTSYRTDLYNYSALKQDGNFVSKWRFLNRSPPGTNTNKKFINRNIHNIKKLCDFNKLRSLQAGTNTPNRNASFDLKKRNLGIGGHQRSNTNFVFFKRKSQANRPFNEIEMGGLVKKGILGFILGNPLNRFLNNSQVLPKRQRQSSSRIKSYIFYLNALGYSVADHQMQSQTPRIDSLLTEEELKLMSLLKSRLQEKYTDEEALKNALQRLENLKKYIM